MRSLGTLARSAILGALDKVVGWKPYLLLASDDGTGRTYVQVCDDLNVFGKSLRVIYENVRQYSRWRELQNAKKEPETINWIRSLPSDTVLYDIGANVGNYSLLAKLLNPTAQVLAFEPEPSSFAALCRTIALNQMDIRPFCFALSDTTGVGTLNLSRFGVGHSDHQLNRSINRSGDQFQSTFSVGVGQYAVDDLVERFGLPVPTHIKIDVDGIEALVIAGMKRMLGDSKVREVAIELSNDAEFSACHAILSAHGFDCGYAAFESSRKMYFYKH